jgi:hypothetical protein
MIIEYALFSQRTARRLVSVEKVPAPQGRPPRIARVLALAHRLDGLMKEGKAKRYRELAEAGGITPTRLSQILVLVALAPDIQEYILFLSPGEADGIIEARLRKIAREPLWDRQRQSFEELVPTWINPENGLAFPAVQSHECDTAK